MRKTFILLFILSIGLTANSQREVVEKYTNGTVRSISFYDTENKKTGTWITYHFNGEKSSEIQYENGKINGYKKLFYKSGKLKEFTNYKNNYRDGLERTYHENGQLKYKVKYENRGIEGKFQSYYANGQVEEIGYRKKGKPVKSLTRYFRDGKLKRKMVYNNDGVELSDIQYYQDGTLREKYDRALGIGESFSMDGKLTLKRTFENFKLKKKETFYPSGKLKKRVVITGSGSSDEKTYAESGELINDTKITKFKHREVMQVTDSTKEYYTSFRGYREGSFSSVYKDNNKTAFTGKLKKGVRDSLWEIYYSNGQLKFKGDYFADGFNARPRGTHQYYWPNGKEKKIEHYTIEKVKSAVSGFRYKTIKTGDWKEYFANGQTKETKTYVKDKLHGAHITYQPTGVTKEIKRYANGFLNGKSEEFYGFDLDRVKTSTTYRTNYKMGPFKAYYPDKKIKIEGLYDYNAKKGPWKHYYPNGNIAMAEDHFDTHREMKFYYADGTLLGTLNLKGDTWYTKSIADFELYAKNGDALEFKEFFEIADFEKFDMFSVLFNEDGGSLVFTGIYLNNNRYKEKVFELDEKGKLEIKKRRKIKKK